MGNEYSFFDESLQAQFIRFAADRHIESQVHADTIAGSVVTLSDDLADDVQDALEQEYDRLMDIQRELIDASEGDQAQDLAGILVTLPNGEPCQIRLPGHYARRLAEHFSFEEMHELVTLIAHGAIHPVGGPLCRKN